MAYSNTIIHKIGSKLLVAILICSLIICSLEIFGIYDIYNDTNSFYLSNFIATRQLLGFGSIFRGVDTKKLKPIIRKGCRQQVIGHIVAQEHPLVFVCDETGKTRFNFRVTAAEEHLSQRESDRIVVNMAYGEDCLYPPALQYLSEPCQTRFTKECIASQRVFEVPYGQGPSCIAVYCDNLFDECHTSVDLDIISKVSIISSPKRNVLYINDASFILEGTGFDPTPHNNKIVCKDANGEDLLCRVWEVQGYQRMVVMLDVPLTRYNLGVLNVTLNVHNTGWLPMQTVGIVYDPWPVHVMQIIIFISFAVLGGCIVYLVAQQIIKEKASALYEYYFSDYAQAMRKMENVEESQRFTGYFDGKFENWKQGAELTDMDILNEANANKEIEMEKKLAETKGLITR